MTSFVYEFGRNWNHFARTNYSIMDGFNCVQAICLQWQITIKHRFPRNSERLDADDRVSDGRRANIPMIGIELRTLIKHEKLYVNSGGEVNYSIVDILFDL